MTSTATSISIPSLSITSFNLFKSIAFRNTLFFTSSPFKETTLTLSDIGNLYSIPSRQLKIVTLYPKSANPLAITQVALSVPAPWDKLFIKKARFFILSLLPYYNQAPYLFRSLFNFSLPSSPTILVIIARSFPFVRSFFPFQVPL